MKQIKLSSMNKIAFMLSRGYFSESDFTLDGDKLVLVSNVDEDYLELVEQYKQFEDENREFLNAFKQLKMIKRELLENKEGDNR